MLGPSGSGKTTTLMMLAGFEAPTHGSILLGGRSIDNIPPHKRDIGMVFQNYALFPHMTVEENLAFPLKVRKVGKAESEARIKRALDMVRLGAYGKRRPGQLSGGQQQRVALARALVFDPKLVLMDEPLGALDKQLREQMQLEIKHIHQDLGVTMVYVTHDQSEALTMSDRIAVFNDGVIQQLAAPAELYERPQNAFVARFIGESNRLDGKVVGMNGTTCKVEIAGGSVEALAINVEAVGGPTVLSLRPERVKLNPAPGSLPNIFSANVAEVIYLGDHVRIRVSVCGHDDFVIKLPNSEGEVQVEPGAAITLGWKTEDCRALEAS
ncbi:ABC transporter ATP-binding protein [Bradyrhizobium sp. LMG 9283]